MSPQEHPTPLVSVVILGYNAAAYLPTCLPAVLDQSLPRRYYEVLYVDNASSDDSADQVARDFHTVRVIRFADNLGYAAGNNQAAGYARGQYLVFLNQDVVVHRDWLESLLEAMAHREEDTVLCSNQVPPHAVDFQAQERLNPLDQVYYLDLTPFGFARFYQEAATPASVPSRFLSGACFMISRQVLERQPELFDPGYFMYGEDLDLGLRLLNQGVSIRYVPGSVCYHAMGSGLYDEDTGINPAQVRKAIRITANRYLSYFKNMTWLEFTLFFPLLFLGSPFKVFLGQWKPWKKILAASFMTLISLAAAGQFCFAALSVLGKRRAALALRSQSPFWLLGKILSPTGRTRSVL